MKKIDVNLDYKKVLENRSNEVYLAASLQAPSWKTWSVGRWHFVCVWTGAGRCRGRSLICQGGMSSWSRVCRNRARLFLAGYF